MKTARLEAFSDGVFAIIITIMVLELKVPHSTQISALLSLWPTFLSYILSFWLVAIYWVNHHHIIHLVTKANSAILWTNMLLLFFLSLIPFSTAYLGENHSSSLTVGIYGCNITLSSIAFVFLNSAIAFNNKDDAAKQKLHKSLRNKACIGILINIASVAFAPISVYISYICFILPPLMYFLPDKRIEEHVLTSS